MTIQKLISEISRKIGSLEIIHFSRDENNTVKAKDLLAGAYVSDGCVEFIGATGTEVFLSNDYFLKYEKLNDNVYKFHNRKVDILIRPMEY